MQGAILGHYRIIDRLGAGGMGEVFVAEDTRLDRRVALKVLAAEVAQDRDRLERFEREAKALAALDHPNIVTVFSVESAVPDLTESGAAAVEDETVVYTAQPGEPVHFLTMQLVEGRPLAELIQAAGMPVDQVLDIGSQLAWAISAAHDSGVIHRDLKPANVMVGEDGRVRILDFGLAKLWAPVVEPDAATLEAPVLTQVGMVMGTMPYMSPEQIQGREADPRSDIFALGVVLYEMATGVRPFSGATSVELMLSIVGTDPPPADEQRPELPASLARLLERCLAKDSGSRIQSAAELAVELARIEPGVIGNVRAAIKSGVRTGRRPGPWLWFAALALAAAGSFFGWRLFRSSGSFETEGPRAGVESTGSMGVDQTLVADRVLVVPFENRTGDSALDPIGLMASDWITQGLKGTGIAEVVSSITVLSSLHSLRMGESGAPGVFELAAETAAGFIVSGSFYRQQEDLLFAAEVISAVQGGLLGVVEPVSTPVEDPLGAIQEVRQRIMVIVASNLDARLPLQGGLGQVPNIESYRHYTRGLEHFIRMDHRQAISEFAEASNLEPEWEMPLLAAAMAHINSGDFGAAEELAGRVDARRESLSTLDRHFLDRILATCAQRPMEALKFARLAAELSTEGPFAFDAGAMALRLNFPREAVNRLERLDPGTGFLRGFAPYWYYLTGAYHALGEFESELANARQFRAMYPELFGSQQSVELFEPNWFEMRALIGLGNLHRFEGLMDEVQLIRGDAVGLGMVMLDAAAELAAHGRSEEARNMAVQAVEWCSHLPEDPLERARRKPMLGQALFLAAEFSQAEQIFTELSEESPEEMEYKGYLGVLGARQDDERTSAEALAWFQAIERPYLFGLDLYWQSAILAWQGNLEGAVREYRKAQAAGMAYGWPRPYPHADPVLRPLWEYQPFLQLIEPRG